MYVVFDLDDTLTDTRHRAHLIPDWLAFYEQCINDPPLWNTLKILELLMTHGHKVEVWTGRCESVRGLTEEWFQRYIQMVPVLKMRPADYRGSNEHLKEMWINQAVKNNYVPNLVFEDRPDIAHMYRKYTRVALVDSPSADAATKADDYVKSKGYVPTSTETDQKD